MDYFNITGTTKEWIILFHGTGGNEYTLLQIAGDFAPQASMQSFLGDVGEGESRRFFEPLKQGQLDRVDFESRVDAFLANWETVKPSDATSITFMGYSNGANFILGLLEKQPAIADRVILLHPSNLNYTFEQTAPVEVYITTGALDGLSVPGDTVKLAKQLENVFPRTTLKLLDGTHAISEQEIEYLQQTFKRS
ncbi:alpha/beta hydrolase [Kurthia senegalensis]|uniref:alpha/beta hydrolase n=1 Tax=Kurthia senegalensis TaxID=1033740 RepID=UPI000289C7F5|nr:hypothetical protein [Kurthia senegalensis]